MLIKETKNISVKRLTRTNQLVLQIDPLNVLQSCFQSTLWILNCSEGDWPARRNQMILQQNCEKNKTSGKIGSIHVPVFFKHNDRNRGETQVQEVFLSQKYFKIIKVCRWLRRLIIHHYGVKFFLKDYYNLSFFIYT